MAAPTPENVVPSPAIEPISPLLHSSYLLIVSPQLVVVIPADEDIIAAIAAEIVVPRSTIEVLRSTGCAKNLLLSHRDKPAYTIRHTPNPTRRAVLPPQLIIAGIALQHTAAYATH